MSELRCFLASTPPPMCEVGRGTVLLLRGFTSGHEEHARFSVELGDRRESWPHPRELCIERFAEIASQRLRPRDVPELRDLFGSFFFALPIPAEYAGSTKRLRFSVSGPSGPERLLIDQSVSFVTILPSPTETEVERAAMERLCRSRARTAICLATYDPDPDLFRRQIESLRAQTEPDWICIVQDDRSTEERFAAIQQICAADARFFVFRSRKNVGFYRNFETCLRRVPSGVASVALCDQDDRWYPDKLAACQAELRPGVALVYADMKLTDVDGRELDSTFWRGRRNHYQELDALLACNTVTGAASLFRASLLPSLVPFPPELDAGGSFHDHFIACAARCSGRIAFISRPLQDYTQHRGNVIGHSRVDTGSLARTRRELAALLRSTADPQRFFARAHDLLQTYYIGYRRLMLYRALLTLRLPEMAASERRALDLFSGELGAGLRLASKTHAQVLWRGQSTGMAELWLGTSVLARHLIQPLLPPLLRITARANSPDPQSAQIPDSLRDSASASVLDPAPAPIPGVKYLAIHLPQFHPIAENDRWWGPGFTEWTQAARARPRFHDHYQPHLPADLGYYDLRLPEARAAQAALARAYGIDGFCYYHYWFQGRRLLERPVNAILDSGEPDFPFCLCWANESWSRRWDGSEQQLLMKQDYDEADDLLHFRWLLRAFRDPRYIRIDGRPLFLIYRAHELRTLAHLVPAWQKLAQEAGLPGLYLVSVRNAWNAGFDPRAHGMQASMEFQPFWSHVDRIYDRSLPVRVERAARRILRSKSQLVWFAERFDRALPERRDRVISYDALVDEALRAPPPSWPEFPGVTPMWDNAARRKEAATILHGSTPARFEAWLTRQTERLRARPESERIVFINAWNEWAEGNHLEPDQRHGRAYLEAVARAKARAG